MTGSMLLDAAIGVVFVILTFSLVASAVNEALATALNWRGRMLRRGLFRLLEGAGSTDLVDLPFPGRRRIRGAHLTLAVLRDPAVRALHGPRGLLTRAWDWLVAPRQTQDERTAARNGRLPSAIPSETFARALVDALVRQVQNSIRIESAANDAEAWRRLEETARKQATEFLASDGPGPLASSLPQGLDERLRDVVTRLAAANAVREVLDGLGHLPAEIRSELDGVVRLAENRLHGVLTDLADWFDRAMERVSGWYVRRARTALFTIGVLLAASINLDLTTLGGRVLSDAALRDTLVNRAEDRSAAPLPPGRPGRETEAPEDIAAGLKGAHETLTELPGLEGPGFGWSCGRDEAIAACLKRVWKWSAFLSWLLIGLGCMMGGQFWYDFMGSVLRFRPAVAAVRQKG